MGCLHQQDHSGVTAESSRGGICQLPSCALDPTSPLNPGGSTLCSASKCFGPWDSVSSPGDGVVIILASWMATRVNACEALGGCSAASASGLCGLVVLLRPTQCCTMGTFPALQRTLQAIRGFAYYYKEGNH